jgi:DedD protein
MEVRVRERLIGALVLVAIVVLLVPAILKGRGPEPQQAPAAQTRRVEVPVGNERPATEEQGLVPEPALPGATPAAPPGGATPAPSQPAAAESVPPPPPAREDAPRKDAPPPAADVIADSPPPKPASAALTPPAAKTGQPPQTAWAVQLGAYANRAKADALVAELRKRRFAAFVLEYRASGQVLYRVRVGPEQDRARAEEIAARLAKEGYQPVVARHP